MALALTIVTALVLVVASIVGYIRDTRRGVVALAGTMLGATLVSFWGAQTGAELTERFGGGNEQTFTLVASSFIFLSTVLLVGYGGGMLLGPAKERPSLIRRLVGVLLGLLNGTLITAYMVQFIAAANQENQATIRESPVGPLLIDGLPLLFLGVAVAVAVVVLFRLATLVLGARKPTPQPAAKPAGPPPMGKPAGSPSAARPAAPSAAPAVPAAPKPADSAAKREAAEKVLGMIDQHPKQQ